MASLPGGQGMVALESSSPTSRPTRSSGFQASSDESPRSPRSGIWQAALDKYYAELRKGGLKGAVIEKDLWDIDSPDDLLAQIKAVAPAETRDSSSWTNTLTQLKPILLGFNDFIAIVAWSFGMDGKLAAVLWGSIRLMIKFAQPVLPELVDMLGELQSTLPRVQRYEQELPMTESLERALFDMYREIIIFCGSSILFFRNNPNPRIKNVWSQFSRDFANTIAKLRNSARRVDEVADMIRLSTESRMAAETVVAMQGMQRMQIASANLPCYNIPYGLNLRFFGREKEVQMLRDTLDPKEENEAMRVIAVQGLGGVGKTQIALHYANTSLKTYDVILWVHAETQIKIVQVLSSFAAKLGVTTDEGKQDDYQAVQKLRDWFNVTEVNYLLVFDNVDDADVLEQIWPASPKASILITTRSPSMASRRTNNILALECFSDDSGVEVLYALTQKRPFNDTDTAAALEICHLLGGLPLAMIQISTFITDRNCLFDEFLKLYKKSAEKIFSRIGSPGEYSHTVSNAWNMSIERLPEEARVLQNMLAFFDPDLIVESLIVDTKAEIEDEKLGFLFDEFDFGDAVMELTRVSLVTRLASSKALSMHRLVQHSVFAKLSKNERIYYMDNAINILFHDFPNTWNATGPYQGHGYESWETCSAVLSHIHFLMGLAKKHELHPSDVDMWAELIFRAGTYLWEKDQQYLARTFFEYGLEIDIKKPSSIAAQAHRLLGHINLDLARPRAAFKAYVESLSIRQMIESPESPSIANIYDSIACSYTEMGDVARAFEYVEKATAIHNAYDPRQMARTDAIRTMACLRAGQPDKALEALSHCWELQGLTKEQVANSKYPKHSGDIVLLGRIRWAQGDKEEGRQLVSRTIGIRRGMFGNNGGPRVADSLFQLALMLQEDREYVLAAKLLREVVDMGIGTKEIRPHHARALWFLAGVEEKIGGGQEDPKELRRRARQHRDEIDGKEEVDQDSDDGFMRLVSWMLW